MQLQRAVGNQAVISLLRNRKSKINLVQKSTAKPKDTDSKALQEESESENDSNTVMKPRSADAALVQRAGTRSIMDQEDTIDDPGINDTVGTFGDYMGTDPNSGLQIGGNGNGTGDSSTGLGQDTAGGVISILTGTVGIGMGSYNIYKNAKNLKTSSEDLKEHLTLYEGDGTTPADKSLFATVELLKRKKLEAQKGIAENSITVLGGISGLINGIAGLAGASILAGVAFAVGAGLNAIVGTISAFRDFFNAYKRSESKSEVGKVGAGYADAIKQVGEETSKTEGEVEKIKERQTKNDQNYQKAKAILAAYLTAKDPENHAEASVALDDLKRAAKWKVDIQNELLAKQTQIQKHEKDFDKYDKMRIALKTAERKQGFKSKIGTGVLGLTSATGGALLLAAALGAAAATGPAGWVISGIALVGILGFAIGMAVKRSIRKDNVERMNQEIIELGTFIAEGKFTDGHVPTIKGESIGGDAAARKNNTWHRDMYGDRVKKKGWFNKLFSKSKSGKINVGKRADELKTYLQKYDKRAAADTIIDGFIESLKDGSEGDRKVKNPAYKDDLPQEIKDQTEKEVTLRDLNMGLLAHFFGDDAMNMKYSLLSTDAEKLKSARTLLAKKLKLN